MDKVDKVDKSCLRKHLLACDVSPFSPANQALNLACGETVTFDGILLSGTD